MTLRKLTPSEMPGWPRGLSRELAAAYVGVSVGVFVAEVERGRWPKPERRGKRLVWDRLALDARFDESSDGATPQGGSPFRRRIEEWQSQRS